MRPVHRRRKCELAAATLAGALALAVSLQASAQNAAPAETPARPRVSAPSPPEPAASSIAPTPLPAPPAPPAPPAVPAPVLGQPAPYPSPYIPAEPPVSWPLGEQPQPPREHASIFIGYNIALPVAELRNFISDASLRGFEMGALWPVFGSLHLGPVFDYQLFYQEKGTSTYPLEHGAVTANLYRYVKTWTVAAAARYFFLAPDAVLRPYLGLRVGVAFVTAATLVSDLSVYETPTGFALSPEAGVLLRAARMLNVSASYRYDFTSASSGPLSNVSFASWQLALVFHNRP